MAKRNTSTALEGNPSVPSSTPDAPSTIARDVISLAKHHIEMHNAFGVGASSASRINIMIVAAKAIVKADTSICHHNRTILKFLEECQMLAEDFIDMLESERDSQLEYSARQEVK